MKYNQIGKTKYKVSEIGFGAEWIENKEYSEIEKLVKYCENEGINLLDCWMSNPKVRSNLGKAIHKNRRKWIIQGHIGSTWQNEQYVKTREMDKVVSAFEDLLTRLQTNYIEFGMIHYVDEIKDYDKIMNSEFIEYVRELKKDEKIKHIGLSTHNPEVAIKAAKNPEIELIMISVNPAFDMMPPVLLDDYFDNDKYSQNLGGIQPIRTELYQTCLENDTAITIMKGFAGGRLLNKEDSPFGVALTPLQCIHYALNRPSAKSILVGVKNIEELKETLKYETATEEEKDYSKILRTAPKHSYLGKCTYCGHCAPCPKGINIAMLNKLYDLATVHEDIPLSIREHYNNLEAHAIDCFGCKHCEERCPFGVEIIEIMKKAYDLFGK
ncbi:MAG: aldo/keto reductase [Methanosphaera sp. rholeuAM6]|nr:MAG: aldo/keto reductase [Methanosphaera sp. rholeuAM6]